MIRPTLILVSIVTFAAVGAGVALATPKDDWPKINGELWINTNDHDTTHTGTVENDELLGGHGDDVLYGGEGHDVIWTDHKAPGNTNAPEGPRLRASRERLGLREPRAQHDLRRPRAGHDPRLVRPRVR